MRENAREWYYNLAHTDPKLVSICLDVDWLKRGGQDPMTLLKASGSRLASLHLRNAQKGVWTESLGDGDVDYTQVAAHLKQTGYAGYLVVELAYEKATELTRSLEEDLRLSRVYAEKTFGIRA
jgi:inosose dehydratase